MNSQQFEAHPQVPARSRLPWILAGAVVAALAVLVAAVVYALNDDDVTARWETADTMTSSPWTPSIVKPGAPVDVPGNFVGAADVTSIAGDDCDKEALKKHLASNPRLAQNWAQILGISVAEINGYIDRLQSRRLTVPVQVTNHDYEGDSPRELQSVLDAGTAVLTDADGTPRVRCACGNPLKPAAAKATKFDNLPPGADPDKVVTEPSTNGNNGTAIRVIKRPFVKTATGIQLNPGYASTGVDQSGPQTNCWNRSATPYGKSTARCNWGGDEALDCWVNADMAYCLPPDTFATGSNLKEHKDINWLNYVQPNDPAIPTTIELANGFACRPGLNLGGRHRDGMEGTFFCRVGGKESSVLGYGWGAMDRSQPAWTIHFTTDYSSPPTDMDIRIAYYTVDE